MNWAAAVLLSTCLGCAAQDLSQFTAHQETRRFDRNKLRDTISMHVSFESDDSEEYSNVQRNGKAISTADVPGMLEFGDFARLFKHAYVLTFRKEDTRESCGVDCERRDYAVDGSERFWSVRLHKGEARFCPDLRIQLELHGDAVTKIAMETVNFTDGEFVDLKWELEKAWVTVDGTKYLLPAKSYHEAEYIGDGVLHNLLDLERPHIERHLLSQNYTLFTNYKRYAAHSTVFSTDSTLVH